MAASIDRGRDAGDRLEDSRQVALIGEPRICRDLRERHARVGEAAACELDAQASDVLADRNAVMAAKRACEMAWMHAGIFREAR